MVREETDKKTNDLKARQIMARNVEHARRVEEVSLTASVNSLRLTKRASWMLERYAGAREHFKFGNRKFRKARM